MSAREAGGRLGRGLAALLGEAPGPHGGGAAVRPIPLDLLAPGPFQPRAPLDPSSLAELTESIRARGVLQPLLARPDPGEPNRYQIIAGERRWRAAQAAGLHEVPALVRELGDADAMAAALVENLQRQDLNAIEEAEGYRRLLDEFGLTQEALAQGVGKSRSHIANTLRLLNLPATVQGEVRNGALSAGHARALLGHPDPARAALMVVARGLNVRQTEALARRAAENVARPDGRERPADPHTTALERMLTERLGLRVDIRFDGRRGSVRVQYDNLDQLDGLVALLMRD
ncbi:MAG: ParB/RepB/Spo0J family partition protein [Alphaproteobacteria bacterium]|nr:ParB/RepB/Spo0J family partition protein [Alphaproteobacteria bacterium]